MIIIQREEQWETKSPSFSKKKKKKVKGPTTHKKIVREEKQRVNPQFVSFFILTSFQPQRMTV